MEYQKIVSKLLIGFLQDALYPGTLCMWADCTMCFESCASAIGECGCLGGCRASPNWSNATADFDPMEKIELEAAEAVARLAHFPANMSESRGNDSVAKRVKDECINVSRQ
ncbi:hypothetical protein L2E82_11327 [Cichorium intybus]|uniref:Uncharacterized protein n=1 Tax=Cichorium intybus TaxID=13427 RepID=A0ACB9GEZ4_CICIN|nr:hypothetical protein L2E82_11327 [Cichorium intybus]